MFQFCFPSEITGCINLFILLAAGPQPSDSIKDFIYKQRLAKMQNFQILLCRGRIYSSIITPVVSGTISCFTVCDCSPDGMEFKRLTVLFFSLYQCCNSKNNASFINIWLKVEMLRECRHKNHQKSCKQYIVLIQKSKE